MMCRCIFIFYLWSISNQGPYQIYN